MGCKAYCLFCSKSAEIGKMDQEALRRTWEQIGTLGPLRKNAGVTTMRRAIKMHLRAS